MKSCNITRVISRYNTQDCTSQGRHLGQYIPSQSSFFSLGQDKRSVVDVFIVAFVMYRDIKMADKTSKSMRKRERNREKKENKKRKRSDVHDTELVKHYEAL